METGKGFSGFVLAGGRSRRMGTNKALLPLGGKRLVDRAIELLSPLVDDVFVVGPPEVFPFLHVPVHPDEIRQAGPLGGILTGLRHARLDKSLVLGVDLPFLTGDVLDRVFKAAGTLDVDVTIPRYHDTQETLCGVYSRRCITPIEGMLMAGHKAVLELLDRVRIQVLEEEVFKDLLASDPFFNINTREDYEEAKRRVAAQLHPEGVHHG
ncbi:MAG: molybdenum cofactor guanylyltransferase [Acidobacteria bacterium]|nr:molybdenum cofactor guanylyltransferase [Acidobacteriota bacterium]